MSTGSGKFTVDNLDPSVCTHMIYAFAVLDGATNTIKPFDSWVDIDQQFYAKFTALKSKNPNLKTMIAIGGYTDSQSSKYSQMANDPNKVKTFVSSVVAFIKKYGFDGLDVDWEYPGAADKAAFGNLLKALRQALAPEGYLLSVAVAAGQQTIDNGTTIIKCV